MFFSDYLNDNRLIEFQNSLLTWFSINKRDFPWRDTSNPYKILIAEKLLQQTKARKSVISAYHQLITEYQNPHLLANAEISDIKIIIQPLGLQYRSKELITLASEIVKEYGGQVPDNLTDLMKLTGIGDYCARAVLSFAYNKHFAIVDTNIARFLFRLFELPGKIPDNPSRKKELQDLATSLLPKGHSKEFNLSIIDLCSLVCKSKKPLCTQCPVKAFCIFGMKAISDNALQ